MILKNTVCIKVKRYREGGKKNIEKAAHHHLIPGLMSVAFKVPIWFFLQTGGICEKRGKNNSYNHHYNTERKIVNTEECCECYVQEVESWVLNAGPEKTEVFSR